MPIWSLTPFATLTTAIPQLQASTTHHRPIKTLSSPAAEMLTGLEPLGNGPCLGGLNMLDRHYSFFSDSGHGWLRVTIDDCKAIGLDRSDFSWYSYSDK